MFGRRRHERPDSYGARQRASWTGLRRPKLHHACTASVALLCMAHILVAALTIQHEEVWTNLTITQVGALPKILAYTHAHFVPELACSCALACGKP